MQRENLRRFLFVSAACLLSFPWLTPCVGIWSGMAVDGAHNAVTHRDKPMEKLLTKQLKEWNAKEMPKLAIFENQPISRAMLVEDSELSWAKGGRKAPRPGTLVGKGASAVVDGLTYTLTWVDPVTWVTPDWLHMKPSTPRRQLILCESPFVLLKSDDIRFIREGKNGPVLLAKARQAWVTVITPDGSFSAYADAIHFRGPAQEVLLEGGTHISTSEQQLSPALPGSWMKLNFMKRSVACSGKVVDQKLPFLKDLRGRSPARPSAIDGLLTPTPGARAFPGPPPLVPPKR